MYQCNVFSALHYLVVKGDSLHGKMSDVTGLAKQSAPSSSMSSG